MTEEKSHVEKSHELREWIVGAALPVAIFVSTFMYTRSKDKADDEQRNTDRIAIVIKSLGSTNDPERYLARGYVKYLADHQEAPTELVSLLLTNARTAQTPAESADAVAALNEFANQNQQQKDTITSDVNNLPIRVYIHIQRDQDRTAATEIQNYLSSLKYAVPGIQLVGVNLTANQVRFANQPDEALAKKLAEQLNSKYSGLDVKTESIGAYAASQGIAVPLRVLELWLVANPAINQNATVQ